MQRGAGDTSAGSVWSWTGAGAVARFTGRSGGASSGPWAGLNLGSHVGDDRDDVAANRRSVSASIGAGNGIIRWARQVHGVDVWRDPLGNDAARTPAVDRAGWACVGEADALVSTSTDHPAAVLVADCAPVVIANGRAVAVVHAGWRGVVAGIVEHATSELRRASPDVGRPRAVVGPCIGPCCFEVGEEVAARFASGSVLREHASGRPRVDLRAALAARLDALGIELDVVDVCTRCDPSCFSHRRDGPTTGRQAVVAWVDAARGTLQP